MRNGRHRVHQVPTRSKFKRSDFQIFKLSRLDKKYALTLAGPRSRYVRGKREEGGGRREEVETFEGDDRGV